MTAQPTSTAAPMSQASLLGLPSELRLRIYDLYLEDLHIALRRPEPCQGSQNDTGTQSTILDVCRTIRKEIYTSFLQTVTFELGEVMTERNFSAWLDAFGVEAVWNLRRLNFYCEGKCSRRDWTGGEEDDEEEFEYVHLHKRISRHPVKSEWKIFPVLVTLVIPISCSTLAIVHLATREKILS